LYDFGRFRLDAAERALTKNGQVVPLTPKAFDTLIVLVRNSGQVVEKDALLKEVWPDTFVEEGVLAVNVAAIRKALSDGEEGPSHIETVPRRGYRFIAEVQATWSPTEDEAAEQKPEPRKQSLTKAWRLAGAGLLALVLAATGWFVSRPLPTSIPPPSSPIPLTSFPGTELSPTFSPDGSQVAFTWNGEHQDNFDIYVKVIDGADALRLTRDPARDMSPAWSPDGRQIAFAREGAVFLIEPTGSGERKVADIRVGDIEWTRDSKSLVVSAGTRRKSQLFLLSVETGEAKELTSPPTSQEFAFGDFNVAVSPDGLNLAFVRWHTSVTSDVYLMPITGGEPRRLTQNEGLIRGVTWTPDGREIVYARGGMWRRSAAAKPGSPSKRVESVNPWAQGPAISHPTAGLPVRLAYGRSDLDTNIWLSDTGNSSAPARKLIASTLMDENPQFSPDARRIAFVSNRSGIAQIWIANSDGSNPLPLTSFTSGFTNSPRWSPDGRRIVFASMQNNNRDLYSVSADGGSFRRLTFEPSEEGRPSWSRDGRWIYCYSNRTGRLEIWKVPTEGGPAVQVTYDGGHESFESPDGKLLYYEDDGIKGLCSISTESSSGSKEGTVVLGAVRQGFWAVAEKGIYFVEFDDRHAASHFMFYAFVVGASELSQPIMFYDFKTKKVSQIGAIDKSVIRTTPSFSVTWDGRYIAWSQVDRAESDLMMIENFR